MSLDDVSLDDQIRRRRAELGCELWAHIYLSERQGEILIAPINRHPDAQRLIDAPMSSGRTSRTFLHEQEGVSLPLTSAVEEIGHRAKAALMAMSSEAFDTYEPPGGTYRSFLRSHVPDREPRASYVSLDLRTDGAHWLVLTKVYEDLNDSELLLQGSVRIGSSHAVVGNWILRMYGAYQQLAQSDASWWRPLDEEAKGC